MSFSPTTIIAGNLTGDPELTYLQSGTAVANFTIAHNPRTFDRARGEWVDGETLFVRAKAWRQLAEHAAESLSRGDRVVAVGTLTARTFTTSDADKRTLTELNIDELGASLAYATAALRKPDRQVAVPGAAEAADEQAPF